MILFGEEELNIEWWIEENSVLTNGTIGNAVIFQIESRSKTDHNLMGMMEGFEKETTYKSLRSAKRGAERILVSWFKSIGITNVEYVER